VLGGCGLITATLIGLVLAERVPSSSLLVWLPVQSVIVGLWRKRILMALAGLDRAAHDLALIAALLARIEREPFASARLQRVRAALFEDGVGASQCIARLESLVSILDSVSLNLLVRPLGALVVARSQLAVAIDRWHASHGPSVAGWLQAIGDTE